MVYIISKDKNIDTEELAKKVPDPHNFLFGFEVYRKTLWGYEIMRELGCHIIYTLKDRDIYAFDADLQELKRELNIILSNIDTFRNKGIGDDNIEFRVQNALEAIKVAERYNDVGVYIG
jgi:hypothetical protein